MYVSEGQNVKQGQKLFAINATSYQAAVDNAAAEVNVAKANVGTHELELNATKQLFEKGVVAEHQYKLDENALLVAQAQLAEAEAALKHAPPAATFSMPAKISLRSESARASTKNQKWHTPVLC